MKDRWTIGMAMVFVLVWDIFVVAGATYLIVWKDRSFWWMILALCLGASSNFHKLGKDDS